MSNVSIFIWMGLPPVFWYIKLFVTTGCHATNEWTVIAFAMIITSSSLSSTTQPSPSHVTLSFGFYTRWDYCLLQPLQPLRALTVTIMPGVDFHFISPYRSLFSRYSFFTFLSFSCIRVAKGWGNKNVQNHKLARFLNQQWMVSHDVYDSYFNINSLPLNNIFRWYISCYIATLYYNKNIAFIA